MGHIGITKLIEEPYKSSLNTENNLTIHHQRIICLFIYIFIIIKCLLVFYSN